MKCMNPDYFASKLRQTIKASWQAGGMTSRIALLMAVFLLAKTAGLIHHEIHPFHHHSETCELFQAMAHPVSDEVYELEFPLFKPLYALHAAVAIAGVYTSTYPAFWGRAPPASLSI